MDAEFDDDGLQEGLATGLLGIHPRGRALPGLGSSLMQVPPQAPSAPATQPAYDVDKAAAYLDAAATPHYIQGKNGHCAKNVREAIKSGGRDIAVTHSAKDYGPSLVAGGFTKLEGDALKNYTHQKGDVIIYPAIDKHADGHMAMYDGNQWVSDFKQRVPYPSNDYIGKTYAIYRP